MSHVYQTEYQGSPDRQSFIGHEALTVILQCDRQRPFCHKCQSSGRECGGYRDQNDVLFRNQSQETIAKATRGPANTRSKKRQVLEPPALAQAEDVLPSESSTIARSPKLEQASGLVDFFANNFVCEGSGNTKTNLFWIPPDFRDLLKIECVALSLQCTGALAVARFHKSPEYLRESHEKYGQAPLVLAETTRQGVEQNREALSLAVIFLSFFEVLGAYDNVSRQSWRAHLSGLATLSQQSGTRYLQSEFGKQMWRQQRAGMLVHALQSYIPVKPELVGPATTDERLRPYDDADRLLIRMADLQAQHRRLGPSDGLKSDLLALDADYVQWMSGTPASFAYKKLPSNRSSRFWWDARYDIYTSAFISYTWCKARAARIRINDLLEESSFPGRSSEPNEGNPSGVANDESLLTEKVRELVTDICATVPLYYRPLETGVRPSQLGEPPPGYFILVSVAT